MSRAPHVHALPAPLALLDAPAPAPDMAVGEALVAARRDGCTTCTDQLTALVMRGDARVVAHLLGAAWSAWRSSPDGRAPGATAPVTRSSARVLRLLLTGRGEALGRHLDGLGPSVLAGLLEDALALLAPAPAAAADGPGGLQVA